jgi:hypothetical protein
LELISINLGTPVDKSLPFIVAVIFSSPTTGIAVPISFFRFSAVLSPISKSNFFFTYFIISLSKLFPATLIDLLAIISSRERIAMSVEPPPISMTVFPSGKEIFTPEPKTAALPSSIRYIFLAPIAASKIALLSILVTCAGTQIIISGLKGEPPYILFTNIFSISLVASMSEITPSFRGLITAKLSDVFPNIFFALVPIATISPVFLSFTKIDGSLSTILFFCLS